MKNELKNTFVKYIMNLKPSGHNSIGINKNSINSFLRNIKAHKQHKQHKQHKLVVTFWLDHEKRFMDEINEVSLKKFLRLSSISETMFESYGKYLFFEFLYLKIFGIFNKKISNKNIIESNLGDPVPFIFQRSTSGNLIHHVYHITQIEKFLQISIQSIDFVYEYGGGYGSLCRAFFQNGFKGKYLIQDIYSFSLLQEFYLSNLGFRARRISSNMANNMDTSILLTSEIPNKSLISSKSFKKSIFIATWSLSEVDLSSRTVVNDDFFDFDYYFIAFRDTFNGFDNQEYFHRIALMSLSKIEWNFVRLKHIPHSFYLFGKRKG
jgi:hypothetical protein